MRQVTVPLRVLRWWLAVCVGGTTLVLVLAGVAVLDLVGNNVDADLLDENLALRSKLGVLEGKLDLVEEEMQRLRLYRTQLDDVPNDVLPGFGPLDGAEVEAAAVLGAGSVVGEGRQELPGEDGTPMDELPENGIADLEPIDAADHLARRSDQLIAAMRAAETELGHRAEAAEHLRSYERALPRAWPMEERILTSGFGWRRSPFTHQWKFHAGLDLSAPKGTPVLSPGRGTVVTAGWRGGYGRTLEIDHGFGIMTRYGHNARLLVAEGEAVQRGQPIATVGMTGNTTGPHLHYEIHVDGVPVDPLEYLE
jgi:murein DD-endopeptidase MepM/ murein hydrolase activator NlpD